MSSNVLYIIKMDIMSLNAKVSLIFLGVVWKKKKEAYKYASYRGGLVTAVVYHSSNKFHQWTYR